MTEPELRQAVMDLADQLGVRWLYFGSDVRRQQGQWRGFPDMFFAGTRALAFRELKASGKDPRADPTRLAARPRRRGRRHSHLAASRLLQRQDRR